MKNSIVYFVYHNYLYIACCCDNKTISGFPNTVAVKEKTVIAIGYCFTTTTRGLYSTHSIIKIEEICDYIRRLTWDDLKDENPDLENGAEYSVTYTYEDETTKTYYFKEDSYFKSENFDWKLINGVENFKNLIENIVSD
ncbi:MAG: hypothetical protein ACLRY5_03135 [Zhenhengia sp.]